MSIMLLKFSYRLLHRKRHGARAQAALEYALLLAAIAFSAFSAMRMLGLGILRSPGLSSASAPAQAGSSISGAGGDEIADRAKRASGHPHTIVLRDGK